MSVEEMKGLTVQLEIHVKVLDPEGRVVHEDVHHQEHKGADIFKHGMNNFPDVMNGAK